MNDSLVVDGLEAVGDLGGDATGAHRVHLSLGDHRGQRRTAQKLHHDVGATVGQHAKVGQKHRVRVVDLRGQLRLLEEPPLILLVLRNQQQLDGQQLFQRRVPRLIDHAHAALAEHTLDLVALADNFADKLMRGIGHTGIRDLTGDGWMVAGTERTVESDLLGRRLADMWHVLFENLSTVCAGGRIPRERVVRHGKPAFMLPEGCGFHEDGFRAGSPILDRLWVVSGDLRARPPAPSSLRA